MNSSPKIAGTQQKLHPGKPESQTNSNTADSGFVVDPQPSSSESDKDQSLFGNSNDNSLPNPNNYYETKIAASDQRDRFQSISSTNMSKSASVSLIDVMLRKNLHFTGIFQHFLKFSGFAQLFGYQQPSRRLCCAVESQQHFSCEISMGHWPVVAVLYDLHQHQHSHRNEGKY